MGFLKISNSCHAELVSASMIIRTEIVWDPEIPKVSGRDDKIKIHNFQFKIENS